VRRFIGLYMYYGFWRALLLSFKERTDSEILE